MNSFDNALTDAARRSGQPLMVDTILSEMETANAKSFNIALRDKKYSSGQLARAIRAMGLTVSSGAINNWRVRNGVV